MERKHKRYYKQEKDMEGQRLGDHGKIRLKGHGNEPNFSRFLHKSIWPRSLTLHFEPFRFWFQIRGDISIRKTTPRR
jgi:hypothetical protein